MSTDYMGKRRSRNKQHNLNLTFSQLYAIINSSTERGQNVIAAIDRALDIYLKDHGNLKPEAIHIHSQKWDDVVREMESSGHEWDGFLWDIPVVQDTPHGSLVLEHKKCILCGIVVGRKIALTENGCVNTAMIE